MSKPNPVKQPVESEGRRRLLAHLTPTMTQHELATTLGVTPQAVSAWVNGTSAPGRKMAAAIERLTGIEAGAWLADAERKEVEQMTPEGGR